MSWQDQLNVICDILLLLFFIFIFMPFIGSLFSDIGDKISKAVWQKKLKYQRKRNKRRK